MLAEAERGPQSKPENVQNKQQHRLFLVTECYLKYHITMLKMVLRRRAKNEQVVPAVFSNRMLLKISRASKNGKSLGSTPAPEESPAGECTRESHKVFF